MRRVSKNCGRQICVALFLLLGSVVPVGAADWPTYLHDFARAGATDEQLSLPLQRSWVRAAPQPLRRAWTEPEGRTVEGKDLYDRVRFDDAFQVAVVGEQLFFGSSVDHRVYCLNTSDGATRWSFFTGAPVRLAPTVVDGRVYAGSDDGFAYCLDAANGRLIWKYRPGPAEEWFIGRGEMISRWPIRTGMLVDDGVAYFGAGVFPHENVYMCGVDAVDGRVIWRNDNISHQEAGREDLSPQGYLLASPQNIFVPSGRTQPKTFDRQTGKLLGIGTSKLGISSATVAGTSAIMVGGRLYLYSPGSHIAGTAEESFVTTGSFLARLDSKSYVKISERVGALKNELRELSRQRAQLGEEQYNDKKDELNKELQALDQNSVAWRTPCSANSSLIVAGKHVFAGGVGQVLGFDSATGKQVWRARIEGDARGLAAANGRLFVSTADGQIYAFGSPRSAVTTAKADRRDEEPFEVDEWTKIYQTAAAEILERTGATRGFCLVVGSEQGRLAYELARQSDLKIYGVDSDPDKVANSRRALTQAGLYGHRVTFHHAEEGQIPYSSYFANLIVSDRLLISGQLPPSAEFVQRHLKPAGGTLCFGRPQTVTQPPPYSEPLLEWVQRTQLENQSQIQADAHWVSLTRETLPGAGNWSHQYAEPGNTASSGDQIVQGGLGVLWYGDPGPELMVNRHQGAVGPLVVDGRMFVQGVGSLMAYDTYNGLQLWEVENPRSLRTGVFQNRAPGNLAAGKDLLFHMVQDQVYAHDVATGEVKAVYRLPTPVDRETHQWGYIAYRDGLLFGTATTRQVIARPLRRRGNPGSAATDAIFAIDTSSGETLWTYQGKSIDFQAIALGPDRAYFIDSSVTPEQREDILRQDKTELKSLTGEAARFAEERMKNIDVRLAVAVDARTGEVLWKEPVDVTDCSDIGAGGGKLTLMYHDETLVLCGANANGHYWKQFIAGDFKRRRLVVLSAEFGEKLWAKDANYRHRPIIIGQRLIAEPWSFDLHTGEQETRLNPITGLESPWSIARPGHHCGMLTGSDNMLVFRSGFTGFYDLQADAGTRHFAGHRLGCWINAIPTNGLVVMPEASAGCVCMFSIASTIVMEPRTPRRPWSLFSQTGDLTPVKTLALNFGAPGDRRDQTGKLWLSWPRPSDKPRNKSTDKTGLALTFDLKTTFEEGGGFVTYDGDATITDSPELTWVTSSGGRGLTHFSIPLLGAEDDPREYNVRLYLAPDRESASGNKVRNVVIQGETVFTDLDLTTESDNRIIREIRGVQVSDNLLVELQPSAGQPVVCAIEVWQSN